MAFDEIEEYEQLEGGLNDYLLENGYSDEEYADEGIFPEFDDSVMDMDFSQIEGKNFKQAFTKVNKRLDSKTNVRKPISPAKQNPKLLKQKKRPLPLTKEFGVKRKAVLQGKGERKISKVIVPRDRSVIVEGVSKFILSQNGKNNSLKQIGYYKGEKLKELVLTFNNNSAIDFNLEIFNPSMPLDYLYSTSQNLNNKVQVAGGAVQYTDVLYNLLANPTLIANCKFVFAGPQLNKQIAIPLEVKNKEITGTEKIEPLNLALEIDTMQVANDIVFFDIAKKLNRPFIPDGMDVINYTVLAGMTVTMAFFYKQVSLKKVFYPEARNSKSLL